MSVFEKLNGPTNETDQYAMFQGVDGVILVSNEHSTRGSNVSEKFKPVLAKIGIPFEEVITAVDPAETNRRIIEAHEAMQAKELGNLAIFLATGDGELGKNIRTLRELGAYVCSLGAGGSGNHYRSLISAYHRSPRRLLKHGFVVEGSTIKANLSNDKGEEDIEAVTTFSVGFTADIAQLVNTEKHRSHKLRKYFPTIAAIPGGLKAIKESEPFTIIVNDQEVTTRALMFIKASRFAKIVNARQVNVDGPIHRLEQSSRSLTKLSFMLVRLALKRSPGDDMKEPYSFTLKTDEVFEIDGETRTIAAGTTISITTGETLARITDRRHRYPSSA
jgi:hypothetical protein